MNKDKNVKIKTVKGKEIIITREELEEKYVILTENFKNGIFQNYIVSEKSR